MSKKHHAREIAGNPHAHALDVGPANPRRDWKLLTGSVLGGMLLGLAGIAYSHGWFAQAGTGPKINEASPPGPAPKGMVWIPGGVFWMGSTAFDDARPRHKVAIDGFWMDTTEVTNEQFARFVGETRYVTVVERWPDGQDLPGVTAADVGFQHRQIMLLAANPTLGFPDGISWPGVFHAQHVFEPFSLVFTQPGKPADVRQADPHSWWRAAPGACWRHPEGPGSDLTGREKHPVVHICYDDALAFCKWADKRLPTEAEWEFAARGGLDRKAFGWGDELQPDGKCMANTWQGEFPHDNKLTDGFLLTAPVGSYPANGFGLHDMAGNAWEWCADWYHDTYYARSPLRNPQGPDGSHDPDEPGVAKRVQRGGSFLCCDNYCKRYMPGGRGKGDPKSTGNNIGFRCAMSTK